MKSGSVVLGGCAIAALVGLGLVAVAFHNLTRPESEAIRLLPARAPEKTESSGALSRRFDIMAPVAPASNIGTALGISGDTLVVGTTSTEQPGSAHVYLRQGASWALVAKLTNGEPAQRDSFGRSVAVDGDRIVVGGAKAEGMDAAAVFERVDGKWQRAATLRAKQDQTYFGAALDLDGDLIAIGAPREDGPVSDRSADEANTSRWVGAVHVFRRAEAGWTEETLVPREHSMRLELGSSVDVDGDTIAVGSGAWESASSGRVYIFQHANGAWTEHAHLTLPGRAENDRDRFGLAISLHGDVLAVGSTEKGDDEAVYVYERKDGQWTLRERISGEALDAGDGFATQLSIAGDHLVATSPGEGKLHLLVREAGRWSLRGTATTTERLYAPVEYDPRSRTFAAATASGVSVFTP